MEINLTNSKGLDSKVTAASVTIRKDVRWVDQQDRQVASRKILKGTLERNIETLIAAHEDDPVKLAEAMVKGDPEVNIEIAGSFLEDVSRIYIDTKGEIVHKISHWEIVRDPEGNQKDKRPRKVEDQNVNNEIPLKWTKKLLPKEEAYRKFIFSGKVQISHTNGLTYDYLYDIAEELEKANALMMLGGGAKGTEPLIFRRGSTAYRGFLEGRTQGKAYALILHLSNMQLIDPETRED